MALLVAGSTSYLMLTMLILCTQLGWIRWRRGKQEINWELSDLDRGRYMWNWAAIAIVAIVAIPTFSIYSFTFWLGPWYLYGS